MDLILILLMAPVTTPKLLNIPYKFKAGKKKQKNAQKFVFKNKAFLKLREI